MQENISVMTGLVSIELVCKYYSIDIDIESLKKKYFIAEGLFPDEILRILRDIGFKASHKKFRDLQELKKYPFPGIAILKDNSFAVVLGLKNEKVLYFNYKHKKVSETTAEEFNNLWKNEAIVLYPKFETTTLYLNFKWLFSEFFKYKSIFLEIIFSSAFIQVFALIIPLFIQIIVDKVLPHFAMSTLHVVTIAFLIVIVFDGIFNYMRNYLLYHTANRIDAGLGSRVYKHLLSLPFRYFETRKVGNIIARLREIENLRQFMTNISLTILLDTIFSIIFIAIMLIYSMILTLIVLLFIGILAFISFVSTPLIRQKLDEKFEKGAKMHAFLVESITGIQTVKSTALEGKMIRKWEDHIGEYILSAFKLSNFANIVFTLSQTLQKLMILGVIYLGVIQVFENKMTIGQLIAFQMFASQLTVPVLRLVHMWQDFQQARLSLERLGDIINTPSEVEGATLKLADLKGEIVFEDVSFRYYSDGPYVLKNVSFKIYPGQLIGIVGRSGSGKSTIAKLVQRLYLPTEGSICIDGLDIKQLSPSFLRDRIGVVPQESFLFSGTIRENIAIAKPGASMEEIVKAAILAGAHEFIQEMPLGYDTPVEEGGRSLSGGQRQRIAIARALISNPRILILDEATSALDYESERIILDSIRRLKGTRTIIFISHRLSFMRECDMVIVLNKGEIVEMGTHETLMKKRRLYAHLYKQQECLE